ncbi:hypothetical protein [Nocardioides pacificus]
MVPRVLTAIGVALLVLGAAAGVFNREVLDADRFLTHVDAVRADPPVSQALGRLLTDRVIAAQPDLTALRPLLESAATAVVASPRTKGAARAAVTPLHRSLTGAERSPVVLRLADAGAVLVASARTLSPRVEAALPADLDVRLSQFAGAGSSQEAMWQAHLSTWLARVAPGLGVVLLFVAGWLQAASSRLRGALASVGRGTVASGVTLALLLVIVGFLVGRADVTVLRGALQRAIWAELDGAFWAAAALLVSTGGLLVLATRPEGLPRLRSMAALRSGPVGSRWSPRWAAAVVVLGGALVLQPLGVLGALVQTAGATIALLGVVSLLVSAAGALRARSARRGTERSDPPVGARSRIAIVVGAVGLLAAYMMGAVPADELKPLSTEATGPPICNGHIELCARRYDDVAFAATHNSMAAADEAGWFFAEQPDGILSQLDHGIRVFLIDSWYGQHTSRPGVIANTDGGWAAGMAEARRTIGPGAVASAIRLRDAFDLRPHGPVKPYLCHSLCELGSTDWLRVMKDVAAWMRAHPREVVTFFVQDQVSPEDTAELVQRAGLRPFVHLQQEREPWPTLGSMLASGRRLVFLMENESGGSAYPWLLDGFSWVQDTPFLFRSPAAFSCAPNRGDVDAPLFLLNHWITAKAREVSSARAVNSREILLSRVEKCAAERNRLPNFVAVDFYDQGDLLDVVDTINGL